MIESPSNAPDSRVRIVLVEDHIILRDGLKALIEMEPDFTVVGEFDAVDQCLAAIDELQPDLVLTDLELPQRSGIELLAHVDGNAKGIIRVSGPEEVRGGVRPASLVTHTRN